MSEALHWVGLSGSLRKGSYNTYLLNSLPGYLPAGVTLDIVPIADIPLYNADLDFPASKERPMIIQQFRERLDKADGLVIVSPEYNYSIPGGLKNAIDWASRGEDSPLVKKPVAIMGVTTGMWGTIRMQTAFHTIFVFLNMIPVYQPEVLIAKANEKFNENGILTDKKTIEIVRAKLEELKRTCLIVKKAG